MSKLPADICFSLILVSLIIGTASAVSYDGEITNIRLVPSPIYVGDPIYHYVTVQNTGDTTLPYIVEVYYGNICEDGNYDNLYLSVGASRTDTWESSGFSTPGTKKITYKLYYDAQWPASNVLLKTYTRTVDVVATSTPPPVTTGSLDISSTPSGASIYIGDSYQGVTPKVISGLSEGSYQVKITRNGYYDYTRTANVAAGKTTTVSATLTSIPQAPVTGYLDISSTPSGASIYVDDAYKGVTPKVISGVSEGSHQVKFTRNGYYDHTRTANVAAGKTTTVSATLTSIPQAPVTGYLDISSAPSGASIYVDDAYKGVTPKVISGVSEGTHQIKITRNGYYDYTGPAYVVAGRTKTVSATLISIPQEPVTGYLDISSSPSGASIYVDGTYKGVTPKVISGLLEGTYEVTISHPGYYEEVVHVSVIAGRTSDFSLPLSPIPTPTTEPPMYSMSGTFTEGTLAILIGLLMIAIVLPAGYLIHSRRNRNNRNEHSRTGGDQRPGNPPDSGARQTDRGQNVTAPQGKAGVLVQNSSGPSPKKPDHVVILPKGGSAEVAIEPKVSITLNHANVYADEWDKIGLTLANTGTAQAFDITLTFSNDVDTRLLRPVDLVAGESTTLDVGIKPRTRGKIPLEIIARYRDAGNQTYKQIASFWLSVEPRANSIPAGSPIPSTVSRPVTPKSLPPEMTERYIAAEYLGKGGFARVFKVQKSDGSWAALKIPISLDAATGKSFIAELHSWTSMVHENIVRVNDYNIMPFPYFEMELCDGTLATLERPIPPDHAAWLIFNIGEGLKYAHARGILHRDLKPQNIMLRDGIPKISDWGLSKVMTQSGTTTVSGGFTAYYAAPEQITNKPKDQRTDIWQLGVIAYELVTGRLPFTGESMVEIGMAIATKVPERPGAVHPDAQPLDAIILKCLEKDPEERYQSVADLQKDLAAYLKLNYVASLKESIQVNDLQRAAYYCGDLVLISMKIGDLAAAYKYAADLARYSVGEIRDQAIELARQIKARVEMGAQELPEELIQKAEVVVHQVRVR